MYYSHDVNNDLGVGVSMVMCLFTVVMVYFVLVVYSLYRQYVAIAFERADKEQQLFLIHI